MKLKFTCQNHLQTNSSLHISICQSQFKTNISMWDTMHIDVDFLFWDWWSGDFYFHKSLLSFIHPYLIQWMAKNGPLCFFRNVCRIWNCLRIQKSHENFGNLLLKQVLEGKYLCVLIIFPPVCFVKSQLKCMN